MTSWTEARSAMRLQFPRAFVASRSENVGSGGSDSYGPTPVRFVRPDADDHSRLGEGLTEESAWLEAARRLALIPDPPEGSYLRQDMIAQYGPQAALPV
jgi:hypothetical protein